MALVDRQRLLVVIPAVPAAHPRAVCPFEFRDIVGLGSIAGTHLRIVCKRVGLVQLLAFGCTDQIFVHLVLAHPRQEQRIDTDRPDLRHHVQVFIPVIKGADHIDTGRMRRPHCKKHALYAVLHRRMCAQLLVNVIMRPLPEYILVSLRNEYLVLFRLLDLFFNCLLRLLLDCFVGFFSCHEHFPRYFFFLPQSRLFSAFSV